MTKFKFLGLGEFLSSRRDLFIYLLLDPGNAKMNFLVTLKKCLEMVEKHKQQFYINMISREHFFNLSLN